MLNIKGTGEKLQLVASSSGSLEVDIEYVQWDTATQTGKDPDSIGFIVTGTTQDLITGNATGPINVLGISLKNAHATASNTVTIQRLRAGPTTVRLVPTPVTLLPGEGIVWGENGIPFVFDATGGVKSSATDTVDPRVNDFRLSGVSATPVMTADSTTLSTLYLAQHKGNRMGVFDGTNWQIIRPPSEVSLPVTGRTTDLPCDIFSYSLAGVLTLEMLNWSSGTARATTLTRVDGILTKTGDATRRYLGTLRPRSATQFHWVRSGVDLPAKFDLWNVDNRIEFGYSVLDSATSHAYNVATIRQWAGSVNYQCDVIAGLQEEDLTGLAFATSRNSTISIARAIGLGFDSTTQFAAGSMASTTANTVASIDADQSARALVQVPIGRHFLALLQWSVATATCTWIGDNGGAGTTLTYQSGFAGEWTC